MACLVGASACDKDPVAAKEINLKAIKMIIKLKSKNQKIIFPTTNSGYGVGQKGIYCDEKTPLNPISLYAKTKAEAEKAISKSDSFISLRLATVFGISPRMRLDLLVNDFTYQAVNNRFIVLFESHFKRNYIHIRDIARVFIYCIENFKKMKNEIYNIGLDEVNLNKEELCVEIKKQISDLIIIKSEVGEDLDKRNYIVSNNKIKKTGFSTKFSLEDGIRELIKGYQIIKRNQFSNI